MLCTPIRTASVRGYNIVLWKNKNISVLWKPLFIRKQIICLQDSTNSEVELKVSLPDRNICVVTIRRSDNTNTVYKVSTDICILSS